MRTRSPLFYPSGSLGLRLRRLRHHDHRIVAAFARKMAAADWAQLLDRGWGRAPQLHAGEDGNDIRVTIRQIVEIVDED